MTLVVVGIAAHEWANLCGYANWARFAFVAGALAIGADLLFGFVPDGGWPIAVTLVACGAATLFWLAVAPTWLASAWRVESKLVRYEASRTGPKSMVGTRAPPPYRLAP